MYRLIKIRLYPNKEQKELLDKTFGCCRFIYNKMLEERIQVYQQLKDNKERLYNHKYKTEKQYKEIFLFLKEVDSIALQSARENLEFAYKNFFRNIKKNVKKKGFPRFKSKKSKQSYTTKNVTNNCKIGFNKKKLKLPKIKTWIKYRDNRVFQEKIRKITISKTRTNKYFASILIEIKNDIVPKQTLEENKIIGFDMSASKFLINKEIELSNPRFYRKKEKRLRKYNKDVSRKKKGSNNRNKAILKLSKIYENIINKKNDWVHKLTHLLSNHFDCIILEDLNIEGMKRFNSGVSKSVTLDFSWNQFINILKYKMEQKGKHLILIDRYFPSSKLCSKCGYKNKDLELKDRKWKCLECNLEHDRDINASVNIKKEGIRILKEDKQIKIISNNDITVGTTVNVFGEDVRLILPYQQFSMNYKAHSLICE